MCVVNAFRNVATILVIFMLFMLIFSVIAVELFKGKFYFCTDPMKHTIADCKFVFEFFCLANVIFHFFHSQLVNGKRADSKPHHVIQPHLQAFHWGFPISFNDLRSVAYRYIASDDERTAHLIAFLVIRENLTKNLNFLQGKLHKRSAGWYQANKRASMGAP